MGIETQENLTAQEIATKLVTNFFIHFPPTV